MNIFTIIFLQNFSKIFSKLHHLKKISRGSMPPNPPNKRVASLHGMALRAMQIPPLLQKKFEPSPK